MAIETETFNMCNYSTSRLVIVLRDESIVIEPGRRDKPSVYPFTMNELQQIANTSSYIQTGYLRPNKEQEEYIYTALRIQDWKDILTDEEVEDIILNPTVEGLRRLIEIRNTQYFSRVYGVFVGLKNVNAPIATNVIRLMTGRYKEMQRGKITTEYRVTEKDIPTIGMQGGKDNSGEIAELKRKMQEQEALIAALTEKLNAEKTETSTTKSTTAKTTTKRKTTTKN